MWKQHHVGINTKLTLLLQSQNHKQEYHWGPQGQVSNDLSSELKSKKTTVKKWITEEKNKSNKATLFRKHYLFI